MRWKGDLLSSGKNLYQESDLKEFLFTKGEKMIKVVV